MSTIGGSSFDYTDANGRFSVSIEVDGAHTSACVALQASPPNGTAFRDTVLAQVTIPVALTPAGHAPKDTRRIDITLAPSP